MTFYFILAAVLAIVWTIGEIWYRKQIKKFELASRYNTLLNKQS